MRKKKKLPLNRRHSHRKKKHTVLKVVSIIFALIIITIASITYAVYRNVESTFSTSYANFPKTTSIDLKKSKTFTTLIIAIGKNNSKNTAYATVLASTNVSTNQTTFMNFPVFAAMPNQKTITEVYNTNGNKGIFQMVKDLLNVPINKVIQIDIDKMGSLVQATGGITMQNPKAFNAEGYEFKQGTVNLQTADQVQAYMTQIDDTDLDASITRIQNVSMELYGNIQKITHIKKLENFNYYREILYAFSNTVKTNISFDDAKTIVMSYNKALRNTSKLNLHTIDKNGTKVVSQTELDSVKVLFEKTLK
jgi:anionic cell wall polymer biosynthesis LytR-Cps2A-Psr (LCP) family protein